MTDLIFSNTGNSKRITNLAVSALDYGIVGDGVADDTEAFQSFIDAVTVGGRGVIPPLLKIRITAQIASFTYSNSFELDGGGSVIKPDYLLTNGDRWYTLLIRNMTISPDSRAKVTNLGIDASLTPYFESTVGSNLRGVGGLFVQNFAVNDIDGFYASDMFFSAGLHITRFTVNNLSNIKMVRVGSKIAPTGDNVGAFDASGDGLYLGNWRDAAQTVIENLDMSSYLDTDPSVDLGTVGVKYGRAGIVTEILSDYIDTVNVAYVNSTTVTSAGDIRALYTIGRRVRLNGGYYALVESLSFSGGVTTVVFDDAVVQVTPIDMQRQQALHHDCTGTNININNYQRSIHQEDQGLCTINIHTANFKGFSCALFNLSTPKGVTSYFIDNATFKCGQVPFAYGSVSGILNAQNIARAEISNSVIDYESSASERGCVTYRGCEINLNSNNLFMATNSPTCRYYDTEINTTGGRILELTGAAFTGSFEFHNTSFNNVSGVIPASLITVLEINKGANMSFLGTTVFNNCDYDFTMYHNTAYFIGAKFTFTDFTPAVQVLLGVLSENVNIVFTDCDFESASAPVRINSIHLPSIDSGYKGCKFYNVQPSQINGGGDLDGSDVVHYSGNKHIFDDGYLPVKAAWIESDSRAIWTSNVFVDKTTLQDITTPVDTSKVAVSSLSNVLYTTAAITKL